MHKMPQTEYKGSRYIALLEELRTLGVGGVLFRVNYELSKKLGLIEKRHTAKKLAAQDVVGSLDLENPSLADVREAYGSHGTDGAVAELIKHFKSRESPRFFFDWRDRDLYQRLLKEQFADQEAQLVEQADRVCRHEIEIFGSKSIEFGDEINWRLEPSAGRDWPLVHWSRIDIRGPDRIGDVRLTWEVNRHQFFFTLGRAYWFTGDEKYAQEFANMMRGWIDANPPEIGVNWYSNLEIAMRLISWIWAYHYFLDSPFFDDELHFDFLRTVLQSCRHITRDFQYSLRSMRNNHVIGDAAALVLAGVVFPEFKESEHWRKAYSDILYRELDVQVYDDGTNFEQATNYHRFVLYFYILLFRIMRLNDYDFSVRAARKTEEMMDFIMYVMKPDGTMPQIGDSDDAKVLSLSNDKPDALMPTLSTGAVLFKRGDFKQLAGRLSEETFWLGGVESIQAFDSLKESIPSSLSRGFPEGGYYIMRTGWDANARYLLFKCGPHADHGHADALHIELYCNGKSCLQDCGTYTYNGTWEWRTFFRSTRAHNTVVVDGESQSIPHRAFRWLKVTKPNTFSWITSRSFDYVDVEHDGYKRYKHPVTHRRSVFFAKPDYWVMVDRLMGRGKHSVELLFHTPTGTDARVTCGEYEIATSHQIPPKSSLLKEGNLRASAKIFCTQDFAIIPVTHDDLDMNIYQGAEEPVCGWFSPCYGVKLPSTTLAYSFTGELPIVTATVLDAGCSIRDVQLSSVENGLAMTIKSDAISDTLVLNWGRKSPVPQAHVDTDAEVVYLREDEASGEITRIGLVAGSYISLKDKPLLKAETAAESIDLTVLPDGETKIEMKPIVDLQLCHPSIPGQKLSG